MRIVAFHAPDAPERERYVAYWYRPIVKKGEQIGEDRLLMGFPARTKELAIASANAWLLAEQAKLAEAAKAKAEREANRKKARAA